MNKTFIGRSIALVSAGIIAVAAYAAVQDISLKRKPKVGDVAEYKDNATFTTDQGEVTFAQKRVSTVTEVKPDGGFVTKVTTSDTKVVFGGQELPDQPSLTSSTEFGPDGLLKAITADMPPAAATYRIANLHAFKAPDGAVKIGDEIKFEIPADKKNGTPGVKTVYTVVSTEKVQAWDTVKLTFSTEETEGDTKSSIKGTVWLNSADGTLIKSQEEWKDVQPQGAPFPVSGKYSIERTK
jgi:hypothetical protein